MLMFARPANNSALLASTVAPCALALIPSAVRASPLSVPVTVTRESSATVAKSRTTRAVATGVADVRSIPRTTSPIAADPSSPFAVTLTLFEASRSKPVTLTLLFAATWTVAA
jgi:hypothetical protein